MCVGLTQNPNNSFGTAVEVPRTEEKPTSAPFFKLLG